MFTLSKDFRFESAHRLAKGYAGKCQNIHGHSWNGTLFISSESLNEHDMSMDFALMGQFLKEIEAILDHKILLFKEDQPLADFCAKTNMAHVLFDRNPTSEAIAEWVYWKAVNWTKLSPQFKIESVLIKETCTSSCTYKIH